MPPSIADRAARADDERFVTVTGRRTTLEYAVAHAAESLLPVIRGVSIAGLLTGGSATDTIPRVAGVRTMDGTEFFADLVVDATGRRSKLPDWLQAIGARRPIEEAEESGFFYYTRFFRSTSCAVPQFRAGFLTHFPSFSLLTLPGDSRTWSVTVFFFTGDSAMKSLRDPARWTRLIAACPSHAHWLDGEPITDVLPMGGITNRDRRFVTGGSPVAGYDVLEALTGEEGVVAAATQRPDLILIDVQLPGIDGLEATRRIKADRALRAIPLIVVTS